MDAGVDSLAAERFTAGVFARTGLALESTAVFEHPTAEAIALHLAQHQGLRTPSARSRAMHAAKLSLNASTVGAVSSFGYAGTIANAVLAFGSGGGRVVFRLGPYSAYC